MHTVEFIREKNSNKMNKQQLWPLLKHSTRFGIGIGTDISQKQNICYEKYEV